MKNCDNLLEVISKRKSIRGYLDKKVEKEKLDYLIEAFRLAPSAKNLQPWKLIIIDDKETIKKLVPACKNQVFISEAPLIIAVCAFEEEAYGTMGGYLNSYPVDIGIAFEHLVLAAAEQGLGTCWIGAFFEEEVKKILKVPDKVRVVALTPIGYPNDTGRDKPRKEKEEIVSFNVF
ncbi:MAG: nitroreductase family protein [Actinomycetota bacterium]|jgi:nitroreductase|nr:nitroreductase family protein [Actinomycetota bacterium]